MDVQWDRKTVTKVLMLFGCYLVVSPSLSITFKWLESAAHFAYPTLIMCPVLTLETVLMFAGNRYCCGGDVPAAVDAGGPAASPPAARRLIVAIGVLFASEVAPALEPHASSAGRWCR